MKTKNTILILLVLITNVCMSQIFYLGESLYPKEGKFKLLGIDSSTHVATYKYIGIITDKYYFQRKVSTLIVGLKNGIIVTTVINVIPKTVDNGVPDSIVDLFENNLGYQLAKRDGFYGVSIDNVNYTISRTNNILTFNKDRIMFFSSLKNNILKN